VAVCAPPAAIAVWQGAMMQRWNAARAEADAEEQLDAAQAAQPSLEELEERKRKRVAEWRDGLSREEVERNVNLTPLAGDWRERAKRGKQGQGRP
jgi:hypothetical protein